MQSTFRRLLADYGMVLVLLLLCAVFSGLTLEEQSSADAAAAQLMARGILGRFSTAPRVLIAVRDTPEEIHFAESLRQEFSAGGATVVDVVSGDPQAARIAIDKSVALGGKLDVVAASQLSGDWLIFADLKTDFPTLGDPQVVVPQTYRWPNFLKRDNLLNIANQIAVIAIVAIGMTMVILTGGIDLSVGSLLALSAVLAAKFIRDHAGGLEASTGGMLVASVAAILVTGLFGACTGTLVTRFDLPPFIVTLATMLVASGLAYILSAGQSVYQIPDSFVWLGRGANLFGLPNAVVLMLLLYGLAHVLMSQTTLGRYLYAVGGNREASRLSGVPVERVLMFAYVASALLAGLGGVIMASQLKSGSPTYGNMYELYVIAAVVVGGTALSGGEGKILGTLIGAFIIAVIQNGMNLTNIESYTQKIVLGLVILGAVLIDKVRHR